MTPDATLDATLDARGRGGANLDALARNDGDPEIDLVQGAVEVHHQSQVNHTARTSIRAAVAASGSASQNAPATFRLVVVVPIVAVAVVPA